MLPAGIRSQDYGQDAAIIRTRLQWVLTIGGIILLFCCSLFMGGSTLGIMTQIGVVIIATLGIQLLTGYCGQISIGHAAFVAVGAYTCAILTGTYHLPFLVSLLCAGIVTGLVGLIFGAPSLRLKGFYLIMSTLAAHFVVMYVIVHWTSMTGGASGYIVPPATIGPIIFDSDQEYFYLAIGFLLICTYLAKNITRTRLGRAFIAIRDNDLAANVMGINVWLVKLEAFFIGCFFAGIAGGLWAHWLGCLSPALFSLMAGIWYLGYIIVGGIGSITGVYFGVLLIMLMKEGLSRLMPLFGAGLIPLIPPLTDIMFGLIIILILILEPRGLYHRWEMFKSYYRLWPLAY